MGLGTRKVMEVIFRVTIKITSDTTYPVRGTSLVLKKIYQEAKLHEQDSWSVTLLLLLLLGCNIVIINPNGSGIE